MRDMNIHTLKWAPLKTCLPGDIAVSGTPPLPLHRPSFSLPELAWRGQAISACFLPHTTIHQVHRTHRQADRQTHSRPKVPLVLKGRRREKRWTGISSIPICDPLPSLRLPYPSTKGVHDSPGLRQQAGVGLEGAASRDAVVGVGQCDGWLIGSCPRGLPLSHLWRWELKGGLSLASPQLLKAARQFHRDQRGHYCCLSGEPSHSRTPQGGVAKGGPLLTGMHMRVNSHIEKHVNADEKRKDSVSMEQDFSEELICLSGVSAHTHTHSHRAFYRQPCPSHLSVLIKALSINTKLPSEHHCETPVLMSINTHKHSHFQHSLTSTKTPRNLLTDTKQLVFGGKQLNCQLPLWPWLTD